ncbi:MAG: peptidoglycan recognition family protein [Desulfobacterales bacterium]|jgi:hypothetical protein
MDTTYSLKLPPKDYRRAIEELSVVIPDPALKLKFLKQAIDEYQKISAPDKLDPAEAEVAFQKKLLESAEAIWPGSKKAANNPIQEYVIAAPPVNAKSKRQHEFRYLIGSAILFLLIIGVGSAVSPLVKSLNFFVKTDQIPPQSQASHKIIIIRKPIIGSPPSNNGAIPPVYDIKSAKYQNDSIPILEHLQNPVLAALTPVRTQNTPSDLTTEKPFLAAQPSANKNHSWSDGEKSEKSQKKIEWRLPEFLDNSILLALTQQKSNNPVANHVFHQSLWSSQTNHRQDNQSRFNSKSKEQPPPAQEGLKYYQIPVLIALNSYRTLSPDTDRTVWKPLSSPQGSETASHIVANIKPEKQLMETQGGLKFIQNPILIALAPQQISNSKSDRIIRKAVLSSQPSENKKDSPSAEVQPAKYANKPVKVPKYLKAPIWLVEKTSDREFYSNRLQIITTHTISNIPREYYRFPKNTSKLPVHNKIADNIAGIVYHASESDIYPFMPEMNHSILKYSKRLIKFLQRKKSYHFFIDRFGRVYRLVREDHAAFHAGHSIWADEKELYLNLNHAFIGICFEGKDFEEINIKKQKKGQTQKSNPARLKPTGISSFNEAQLRSGKELTDWLRVKYNIPQQNCVPHALISVNPKRMLIGYHLDLARGFPFAKFGLSDKYREPLPSMVEFGFRYDAYFKRIFNNDIWPGIRLSEKILQVQAVNSGMRFAKYRKSLQRRFSRYAAWRKKMMEKKEQFARNP